jgi:hypothetical protein
MAVTYALATNILYKCGANVNSTYSAAGYLEQYGYMAEAVINSECLYDWSAWYTTDAGAHPHVGYVLVNAASCLAAIDVINADMSGFTNIQEAVSRIDVLYQMYQNNIRILKSEGVMDFVKRGGT